MINNGLDKFIQDAIDNGKSSSSMPANKVDMTYIITNDEIRTLEDKKAYLEEITKIENSIISMHMSIHKQEQIANTMLSIAMGGAYYNVDGGQEQSVPTLDIEQLNFASNAQSKTYQNKRDFHSHVLAYNKTKENHLVQDGREFDVEEIKKQIDAKIQAKIKERQDAMQSIDSTVEENNEEETKSEFDTETL